MNILPSDIREVKSGGYLLSTPQFRGTYKMFFPLRWKPQQPQNTIGNSLQDTQPYSKDTLAALVNPRDSTSDTRDRRTGSICRHQDSQLSYTDWYSNTLSPTLYSYGPSAAQSKCICTTSISTGTYLIEVCEDDPRSIQGPVIIKIMMAVMTHSGRAGNHIRFKS